MKEGLQREYLEAALMKSADILTGPAQLVLDPPLAKRKFIQSPTQGDRSAPNTSAVDVPNQLRCERLWVMKDKEWHKIKPFKI